MNERIKELAHEVFSFKYKTSPYELNPGHHMDHLHKFAELIVQKCVSIVALHGINNFENEDISWACKNIVKEVKEHFGVE